MSIKHAVLGLLAETPRHGYAVRTAFEERLGDFWELNYGQVYQVLATLEAEGWITGTDEQVGRRPVRRIYGVTAKGRGELHRWLTKPTPLRRPFRDEFYVRLLFAAGESVDLARTMIDEEIRLGREHLAKVMDQAAGVERLGGSSWVRKAFARAAALHAEADLKALQHSLAALASSTEAHLPTTVSTARPRRKAAS